MTGLELNERLRQILSTVTRETCLSATREIADLGFGAATAFALVCAELEAAESPDA
jgi:hypothetical protein